MIAQPYHGTRVSWRDRQIGAAAIRTCSGCSIACLPTSLSRKRASGESRLPGASARSSAATEALPGCRRPPLPAPAGRRLQPSPVRAAPAPAAPHDPGRSRPGHCSLALRRHGGSPRADPSDHANYAGCGRELGARGHAGIRRCSAISWKFCRYAAALRLPRPARGGLIVARARCHPAAARALSSSFQNGALVFSQSIRKAQASSAAARCGGGGRDQDDRLARQHAAVAVDDQARLQRPACAAPRPRSRRASARSCRGSARASSR